MKIKKNDKVKIVYGKDNGKTGKVEKIYKKQNKALIAGLNLYKKHIKKNEKMPKGGVVEVPRPIDLSKLMVVCPKCGKTTRVGFEIKAGKKNRICRKCKSVI